MTITSVFLSNARQDDALASAVAALLRQHGCDVWWHEDFSKSAAYRARTQQALAASQVVVVIWSAASRVSPWVIDEADAGTRQGPTVSLEVGDIRRPMGFSGSIPVKVQATRAMLSTGEQEEIREAVFEAASDARAAKRGRRTWFDRSIAAGAANLASSAVLFAALMALAVFVRWPAMMLGAQGRALTATLFATAVLCGYAADWFAQKFGTAPRRYRVRLACRWLAEGLGAGLGSGVFIVALRLLNPGRSWSELLDTNVLIVVLLVAFVSATLLSAKFVPLLMSRHLQRRLLGRPT